MKGLFRAISKLNNELLYGYYVHRKGSGSIYRTKDLDLMLSDKYGFAITVLADTVCMYTGKADKDGNKIFERDILEVKQNIYSFDVVALYIVRDFFNGLILLSPCDEKGNRKPIEGNFPLDIDIPLYSVPSADIKIVGNTIEIRKE